MNYQIKFPALVIGTSSIEKIDYRHFAGNKKYIKQGYKDVVIIDSDGYYLNVEGTKQIGGLSLVDSILNFDLLVKMEPILKNSPYQIGLDEMKNRIISIVGAFPNKFSNLDDKDSLIAAIRSSKSIREIMNIF